MKMAAPYPYASQDVRRMMSPIPPRPQPKNHGWVQTVEDWMNHHPGACAAAAVAIGVTLGWLIKRR